MHSQDRRRLLLLARALKRAGFHPQFTPDALALPLRKHQCLFLTHNNRTFVCICADTLETVQAKFQFPYAHGQLDEVIAHAVAHVLFEAAQ